ncbi:hypothetical protein AC480_04270 [miscellaneous Crenarchaeota group archaeon SMTZ1-55]|nr:MAG: hypothetical protein AC480_04270 [miscellaneous Crenarchaeota group archaeon SMTZ1-55]
MSQPSKGVQVAGLFPVDEGLDGLRTDAVCVEDEALIWEKRVSGDDAEGMGIRVIKDPGEGFNAPLLDIYAQLGVL